LPFTNFNKLVSNFLLEVENSSNMYENINNDLIDIFYWGFLYNNKFFLTKNTLMVYFRRVDRTC